jgi:hypothetical protein
MKLSLFVPFLPDAQDMNSPNKVNTIFCVELAWGVDHNGGIKNSMNTGES